MNKQLIFALSLFGLFMAFGTVYFIPMNIEPFCWGGIFLLCAIVIAMKAPGKYFLHGFLVSLVNCIWITGAHVLLFSEYIKTHSKELEMMAKLPMANHPRIMMLVVGPLMGIVFGIILGGLSWLASLVFKKR